MELKGTILYDQERLNELKLFTRQDADPATDGFSTILTGPLHEPYSAFCQMVATALAIWM